MRQEFNRLKENHNGLTDELTEKATNLENATENMKQLESDHFAKKEEKYILEEAFKNFRNSNAILKSTQPLEIGYRISRI